jgi:hypothetical protein
VTKEAESLSERATGVVGIELRPKQRHDRVPAPRRVVIMGGEVNEEGEALWLSQEGAELASVRVRAT